MTREEYVARMNSEDDWAPGWDAVEEEFNRLYPGREPSHYGTEIHARAIFGGDNYLDGYSIYDSGKGYQHIVTFGMSELYTDEDAFGGEYSRWGYEMTIKLKEDRAEDCLWALDMLSNLARYTYTTERFFEAGACVPGRYFRADAGHCPWKSGIHPVCGNNGNRAEQDTGRLRQSSNPDREHEKGKSGVDHRYEEKKVLSVKRYKIYAEAL